MTSQIPVVLFTYARPDHLRRTLDCLRDNTVPVIYAYSDGPGSADKEDAVASVRAMLRSIDWCEVVLCERATHFGLGRSILAGVTEVLAKHDSAIVFEDDLICVPGTYQYLSAALEHYRHDDRVMSVTGWTHPLVTPRDVTTAPYFDGRAECWVWGTWSRAWEGMEVDARTLMEQCRDKGIDVYKYGADLVTMAETELARNIWAVRLLYLHILRGGLCLRPPWSLVEHIGFDANATNARDEIWLRNTQLKRCPATPAQWPQPIENRECAPLHRKVSGSAPTRANSVTKFARRAASKIIRTVKRTPLDSGHVGYGLSGDYESWKLATNASSGYDSATILAKTRDALLRVRDGNAPYERDSVVFDEIQYAWPLLSGLMWVAARSLGRLDVLDLGGSLGSTYFQNRAFLSSLESVRWNVVEQPGHVAVGKQHFESGPLHFYQSIDACLAEASPDVVLLSSVLQYLEKPHDIIRRIGETSVEHLIIDRTPFWDGPLDRLSVQTVPPSIYAASYPIWIFSKQRLDRSVSEIWECMAEFDSIDALHNHMSAVWRGMILKRREK